MLNDQILAAFTESFYGYGNYQAQFWFIGMEEGGGETVADISQRLKIWNERGCNELEDLAEFHNAVGIAHLFNEHPELQPTWKQLIRIVLTATEQGTDTESIRTYQKNILGRIDGDTCLLELLPLPSPNTRTWLYGNNSSVPYLADRKIYRKHLINLRIAHLKTRLSFYKPKVVIFYGRTYQKYWREIAGIEIREKFSDNIEYGINGKTLFIITFHPADRRTSNEYFNQVGRLILKEIINPKKAANSGRDRSLP